ATNCPEYKVTAVQVSPSNGPSDWQREYNEQAEHSRRIAKVAAGEAMSSPLDRLVMMANQIGKFFTPQRDGDPVAGIADHLEKFWDPRMKASIVAHWRAGGGGAGGPVW